MTDQYRITLAPAWFGRTRVTIEYLTGMDSAGSPVGPQRLCRFTTSTEGAEREAASMVEAIQNHEAPGAPFRLETRGART